MNEAAAGRSWDDGKDWRTHGVVHPASVESDLRARHAERRASGTSLSTETSLLFTYTNPSEFRCLALCTIVYTRGTIDSIQETVTTPHRFLFFFFF